MEPVIVRPMAAEDIESVMRNEVRAYEFPWSRGVFLDCLRGSYECWVLTDGDVMKGHGVLSFGAGEAHVLNVCVGPDHQGTGLGRVMLAHLLERALFRHAEVVFLEVRVTNVVAAALYESVGFNEIGRRRNYYPARDGHEDARVLALQLQMPGSGGAHAGP
jgi:ribosomal-protein-alanine N-acetyltransferase